MKTMELLEYMKSKPNAFIRTSVIAGHPGESEESYEKLCTFMEDFGFDRFNTFHYSNEETTPYCLCYGTSFTRYY